MVIGDAGFAGRGQAHRLTGGRPRRFCIAPCLPTGAEGIGGSSVSSIGCATVFAGTTGSLGTMRRNAAYAASIIPSTESERTTSRRATRPAWTSATQRLPPSSSISICVIGIRSGSRVPSGLLHPEPRPGPRLALENARAGIGLVEVLTHLLRNPNTLGKARVARDCRHEAGLLGCGAGHSAITRNVTYRLRSLFSTAPATRFPAAAEPYSRPAFAAILPKFFPGLPKSLPAAPALAE